MAQGLEMPNALDRVFYRFLVNYISFTEIYFKSKSVFDYALQYLELDLAHQLDEYLPVLAEGDVKRRVLAFENL